MYRIIILTAAPNNRPANYQYISDKGVIFETNNLKEALARFEMELDNYEMSKLKIVKSIEIKLNMEGIDICSNCGSGGPSIDPDVPIEGAYSYNSLTDKPRINNVTLKYDKTAEDLGLQEQMTEYTNEELDILLKIQG